MSRRFQTRRASRVSRCNSCNSHPRTAQAQPSGNTHTAANRATQGTTPSSTTPRAQTGGDQVKLSTRQDEHGGEAQAAAHGGGGFGGFLNNLTGNLAEKTGLDKIGDLTKKLTPLQLNDQDRALVSKAQEVHQKLAGSDGVWDASDRARNLQQMQGDLSKVVDQRINQEFQKKTQGNTRIGTRFKQAIGRMHMKRHYGEYKAQGMGQANSQASAGLRDGQQQLGISEKTAANKNSQPQPIQPLTVAELETFSAGMKRLEQLGKEQGKPHARFTNGLPNQFFSDVLGGKLIPAGVDLTGP